jgi:hypothetical protein
MMAHDNEVSTERGLIDELARALEHVLGRLESIGDNSLVTRHAVESAHNVLAKAARYRIRGSC